MNHGFAQVIALGEPLWKDVIERFLLNLKAMRNCDLRVTKLIKI